MRIVKSRHSVSIQNYTGSSCWVSKGKENLSYPANGSINDSIPDSDATVHYASTDDAISVLNKLDPGCVLSKVDIQSAFKIIPVHPAGFQRGRKILL